MGELFSWVYRLLRSKLLGVLVILAMAVVSLMGTMIRQAPAEAARNPAANAQFLDEMRSIYGGWTGILDFLGFFRIWTSPLFLSVTVLLGLSIVACTVHRIPQLVERAMHPRTHVSARFFDHAQYRAEIDLPVAPEAALEAARETLRQRRFRILPDEKTPETGLYADRFRFGPFGTVVAHASFIIIMAAFGISAFTGIDDTINVGIGETVRVGHGTDLTVTATSFDDDYDEQGRPLDYVSHLIVHRGDAVAAEADVRVNSPLTVDGFAFHQASFGVAAQVTISGAEGIEFNGSLPLNWASEDGNYVIARYTTPSQDVEIMIVTPASGATGVAIPAGDAVIEIYDNPSGQRLAQQAVQPGGVVTTDPYSVTFLREQLYTGIMIRQDPGAPWMWLGSVLLVVGMVMTFGLRHRRIWVRVDATDDGSMLRVASAEKDDTTFERQFRVLIAAIDDRIPHTKREELTDA